MKKLWNKDFILMLQGNAFSALGDVLYSVAIGYWVFEETGSTALMGIMSSISLFMTMFLMPVAGTFIDQINRKSVIVGMDFIRGIVMLITGMLAWNKKLSVPIVLVVAVVASLCTVFFSPAVETVMLDIIPKDNFLQGQSISRGLSSFIQLVGKAISGSLVAFFGVPIIIVLNGVSLLISAFTECFITVPKTQKQSEKIEIKKIGMDLVEGAKSIFQDSVLKILIPSSLLANLLSAGSMSLAMPFCLEKGLNLNEYGYLMALSTGASLICIALLGVVKLSAKQRYYALTFGFLSGLVFFGATYLSHSFYTITFWYMLGCFMNTLGNSVFNASLMLALPEANRGSILGFIYAASSGGQALSSILYGFLGEYLSLTTIFSLGNLFSAIPLIYLCVHKKIKNFVVSH